MSALSSTLSESKEGAVPYLPYTVEKYQWRASIQAFSTGGYEATIKLVDVEKVAAARDASEYGYLRGKRLPVPEESRNESDIERAAQRARKTVRHKCKEMGADRLLTLTTREVLPIEELLKAWQKFTYLIEKATGDRFLYLAVPEPHPSNPEHLHLHVAVNTFLKVEIVRKCWHAALMGRGGRTDSRAASARPPVGALRGKNSPGNVDLQLIKVRSKHKVMSRVARYISKYVTKDCLQRFNKKRYWSTKGVQLMEVRRIWLKSASDENGAVNAFQEFRLMMGLENLQAFQGLANGNCFFAPSGELVWLQVNPDEVPHDPPPF